MLDGNPIGTLARVARIVALLAPSTSIISLVLQNRTTQCNKGVCAIMGPVCTSFVTLLLTGTYFCTPVPLVVALFGISGISIVAMIDALPSSLVPAWFGDLTESTSLFLAALITLYATEYFLHTAEALDDHSQTSSSLYIASKWSHRASVTLGSSVIPLILAALLIKYHWHLHENKAVLTAALCVAALGVTLATNTMELLVCLLRPAPTASSDEEGSPSERKLKGPTCIPM